MIVSVLCCSGIRANGDFAALFTALAISGVLLVGVVLLRSLFGTKPPRINIQRTLLEKTLLDGKEPMVVDHARLSQVIETLGSPGTAQAAKLLDPNSPVWAQLNDAFKGSGAMDPGSPFPVIIRVRSALLAHQLDSVRHLLSDRLYQRLSAAAPVLPSSTPNRLVMVTNKHSGDDPNRIVVRLGGSVVMPGATAEDWTLVRTAPGPTAPAVLTLSPSPTAPTAPVAPPSTCPYCSAQLDPGATRCRFCGMDVTLAAPALLPTPATEPQALPAGQGWIVDDVSAANPLAA